MHQQLRTFSKVFQEHIQLGYITPPRPPKQLRFWNTKTSIQKTKNLYSSHKSTPQPHISGVHASLKLHTLSHSDRNPGPKQKTEPSSNDYRGHKKVSMQTQSAFLFSARYNQKSLNMSSHTSHEVDPAENLLLQSPPHLIFLHQSHNSHVYRE